MICRKTRMVKKIEIVFHVKPLTALGRLSLGKTLRKRMAFFYS